MYPLNQSPERMDNSANPETEIDNGFSKFPKLVKNLRPDKKWGIFSKKNTESSPDSHNNYNSTFSTSNFLDEFTKFGKKLDRIKKNEKNKKSYFTYEIDSAEPASNAILSDAQCGEECRYEGGELSHSDEHKMATSPVMPNVEWISSSISEEGTLNFSKAERIEGYSTAETIAYSTAETMALSTGETMTAETMALSREKTKTALTAASTNNAANPLVIAAMMPIKAPETSPTMLSTIAAAQTTCKMATEATLIAATTPTLGVDATQSTKILAPIISASTTPTSTAATTPKTTVLSMTSRMVFCNKPTDLYAANLQQQVSGAKQEMLTFKQQTPPPPHSDNMSNLELSLKTLKDNKLMYGNKNQISAAYIMLPSLLLVLLPGIGAAVIVALGLLPVCGTIPFLATMWTLSNYVKKFLNTPKIFRPIHGVIAAAVGFFVLPLLLLLPVLLLTAAFMLILFCIPLFMFCLPLVEIIAIPIVLTINMLIFIGLMIYVSPIPKRCKYVFENVCESLLLVASDNPQRY